MRIGIMLRAIDEKEGVGIYTQNLMDHLLNMDRKNEYVLFYYNPASLGRYASYENVREKWVRAPNKIIWDQISIPLEAKREDLDLLFHPKFTVPLLVSCKTIMVSHGSEWFVYPKAYRFFDRVYIKSMMPLYCKKADLIISNSEFTKHDFINILKIKEDKIKTIYFGVNPIFRPLDDPFFLRDIRERYGLPERFILYVGRIYPGKNFGSLVKAFSKIHKKFEHRLVVAGDPRWGFEKERDLISRFGLEEKIIFKGWIPQSDLVGFYNLADLFILTSFYESFGMVILEAMASGCPVIASKTGAIPEIAGDAALFIDPYDPDNIAEAIEILLCREDLRKGLRNRGLERARGFGWDRCARETLLLFEECISKD